MKFNRIIANLFFLFFLVEGAIVAQPIDKKKSDKRIVTSMDENTRAKVMDQIQAEQYANEIAKYSQEMCPLKSGDIIIDSIVYDYRNLIYYGHLEFSEQMMNHPEAIKASLRDQMVFAGSESSIFTTLAQLNSGWRVDYQVLKADTTITVLFTPEEIKEMVSSSAAVSERDRALYALNATVKTTNANLPRMIDSITRLDSVGIKKGNFVHYYTILNQFEMVKKNKAALEQIIRMQFITSQDVQTKYLLLLCVRAGYGICHCYTPASTDLKQPKKSEIINICISKKELKEMVK